MAEFEPGAVSGLGAIGIGAGRVGGLAGGAGYGGIQRVGGAGGGQRGFARWAYGVAGGARSGVVAAGGAGEGEGLSLARRLAPVLEEWNQRVVVASEVAASGRGFLGVAVESTRRESWGRVLRGLQSEGESEVPLRGVVHLAGLDGGGSEAGAEELAAALEGSGSSALALTQALEDEGLLRGAGLWFVTRGGQVVSGERGGELSGAALWGFGRTVARELPDAGVRLVDLDPEGSASAEALVGELLFPDRETGVAHRGGVRWSPRLVREEPGGEIGEEEGVRIRGTGAT